MGVSYSSSVAESEPKSIMIIINKFYTLCAFFLVFIITLCFVLFATSPKYKSKLNSPLTASQLLLLEKSAYFYPYRTEGLLLRGAIKPDERPMWFDVFKVYPPYVEPKFARSKPEEKPIRQILYQEDAIRAKFHANGHGLNVNMLTSTGEPRTRKLIRKYEQLQAEGIPEDEIIRKSVEAVDSDRQTETTKISPKNPETVTAQVLAEADLKNIFKE